MDARVLRLPQPPQFDKLGIVKLESDLQPVPARTLRQHSVSMARRLLAGAGRASVLAFRTEPQICLDTVVHGLALDGALVVAVAVDAQSEELVGSTDVRLDVEKYAPDPALSIRAATLHALGTLEWVEPQTAARWKAEGRLPGLVADLVDAPGIRLATVEIARVLVHDCAGVTALDWADVTEPTAPAVFPSLFDELEAVDVVCHVSDGEWLRVIEGVLTGRIEGAELARIELRSACHHILGAVSVVDVDAHGLTLMHFTYTHATTLFVPFLSPALSVEDLSSRVGHMLPQRWSAA